MGATGRRPLRLANGTCVHVKSPHFAQECDGRITEAYYDTGWIYRVEVTAGDISDACRNKAGEVWVWDFEVTPLP